MADLGFIDLPSPSWVENFRGPTWAPLWPLRELLSGNVSSNINASLPIPPCLAAGSDCEGLDALQLFAGFGGGVALELGGLDGVKLSETLLLEQHAGFRRIIIEADPKHRHNRRKLAPNVVGVHAAVCSNPGHFHYLHNAQTSGLAEFMSTEYLEAWFPSLLPQLLPPAPSPLPLNVTPGCFIPDYSSWCRARTSVNQARSKAPERICVQDLKCRDNEACGCEEPPESMPRRKFTVQPWTRCEPSGTEVLNCTQLKLSPSTFVPATYKWGSLDYTQAHVQMTRVACTTLTALLEAIGIQSIHFAILDTEGAELNILQTVDFTRIRFGILVVETNRAREPNLVINASSLERASSPSGGGNASNHADADASAAAEEAPEATRYSDAVTAYVLNASHHQYRLLFPAVRGRNLWFVNRDFAMRHRRPGMQHGMPGQGGGVDPVGTLEWSWSEARHSHEHAHGEHSHEHANEHAHAGGRAVIGAW